MTDAIAKAVIRSTRGRRAIFRNFLRLVCLGEISGNTSACRCIEFLRRRSASVSSRYRRRGRTCVTTFPRVRAVGMLAMRATAERVRATTCDACDRVLFSRRRRDEQVDPHTATLALSFSLSPSLARSDIRFDRFHGWSALVHYVLPSRTERIATHCHFCAREAEGSRSKIIGSDIFISLRLRKRDPRVVETKKVSNLKFSDTSIRKECDNLRLDQEIDIRFCAISISFSE